MTSIFKKLGTALRKGKEAVISEPSVDKPSDRRLHQRFDVSDCNLIYVRFPDQTITTVTDLSYGGFAASSETSKSITSLEASFHVTLHVLGAEKEAECVVVRRGGQSVGFSFIHSNAETLVFLRSILEDMRTGSTVSMVKSPHLHERYADGSWTVFRGDGPTDIVLRTSEDNATLIEGLVTFRSGKTYSELSLKDGKIMTGRTIDGTGPASRVAKDSSPDEEILRHTVQVLLGAYATTKHENIKDLAQATIEQLSAQNPLRMGA